MKQVKLLIFLIFFTIVAVGATLFYSWYVKKDHLATLGYIPDTYWLPPQKVEAVNSYIYDSALDEQGIFHIVWGVKSNTGDAMELKHIALDKNGKPLAPEHTLLTNPKIEGIVLGIHGGKLNISWIGQGKTEKLDLYQLTASFTGQVVEQKTIIANEFIRPQDLSVVTAPNGSTLALWGDQSEWTAKEDEARVIKTVSINPAGQVGRVQQVASGKEGAVLPRLIVDDVGRYHLVWCQRVYKEILGMYYQRLNINGEPEGAAYLLDKGYIQSLTMIVRGERLYLAWAMEKDKFYRVADIYGMVLDVQNPASPHQSIKLSKDGSNYSPVLAFDEEKHLRLVYIKNKIDYKGMVHQKYEGDFTRAIAAPQWIYPEAFPAAKLSVKSDALGHLHVACLELADHTKYSIQYTNSVVRQTITPMQIVGLNSKNYKRSLLFNTVYILGAPVLDLIIFANFFGMLILMGLASFLYGMVYQIAAKRKLRLGNIMERYYVALLFLGAVEMGSFFGIMHILGFKWPLMLAQQNFVLVFGLPWLGILLLSRVMKLKDTEIMNASFTLIPWGYWFWVILMILNMPALNYAIPPVLLH